MKRVRQEALQALLREHGRMTVGELAGNLAVSEATIRRDLHDLRSVAGFERMHGGAGFNNETEPPVVARRRQNAAAKKALARRAAEEIYDGATIFVGSGSTMAFLAECLADRRELTVVTNAHNVASELAGAPGVDVVVTGGALRKGEMSLIGPIAEGTLRQMPLEVAFMSVQGITAGDGLTNIFAPEANTDRVVVDLAPRLVVVAEAYKIGRKAPIRIGPAEAIDLLVTDARDDDPELRTLAAAGLTIAHAAAT